MVARPRSLDAATLADGVDRRDPLAVGERLDRFDKLSMKKRLRFVGPLP
jgi:hypothetical protein